MSRQGIGRLVNAIGFQAGWWACVIGAAQGQQALAIGLSLLLVAAHLVFAHPRGAEVRLALASLVIGVVVDSLLQAFGVLSFAGASWGPLSPPWLWMLWVLFALTLNASLDVLKNLHGSVVAVLGAVFGPVSYIVGARLGAATFDGSMVGTAILALTWAAALPALVALAKRHGAVMPAKGMKQK